MSLTMNITDSGFKIDAPLALPEDEVQLWRVDLEAICSDESRWQRMLSRTRISALPTFIFRSIVNVLLRPEPSCEQSWGHI
jgi:hypothetical protein